VLAHDAVDARSLTVKICKPKTSAGKVGHR
jgi:hypothetical protein